PAEQHETRSFPCLGAAIQCRDVAATDAFQPARKFFGQAAPIIHAANTCRETWQQGAGANFSSGEATRDCPEQMRCPELPIFTRIQESKFLPITDPGMQRFRRKRLHGAFPGFWRITPVRRSCERWVSKGRPWTARLATLLKGSTCGQWTRCVCSIAPPCGCTGTARRPPWSRSATY